MKFLFPVFCFLAVLSASCNDDDCYSEPEQITFELLNSKNENLIANGTLTLSDIFIYEEVDENTKLGISKNRIENNYLIINPEISRFNGTKKYVFITTTSSKFNFDISSSSVKNCKGYTIDTIAFYPVEAKKEKTVYKIIL
ncbi:hypothetical protein [Empedobacter brevis]|uniref:hypothetical protein n=1 Tax=Empedobacter brevis TaxID=247 RepID=UPI002896E480|nr:hypothetical protein [Empedobacter brevis]